MPIVTVVIPAFNPDSFLREALESVRAQTFCDWEAIVVDDGSTEDLGWVGEMDARIRLHRQPNGGLSAARNAGILRAQSNIIAFLDADDLWEPRKLECQLQALSDRPDAVLCHSGTRFVDAEGTPGGLGWGGTYQSFEDLLAGNGVCVSSVIIRLEPLFAAGLFDPLLSTAQDYDLWLKVTRLGPMAALPEPLVRYRWHANNMSRDYQRILQEQLFVLTRHLNTARRAGKKDIVKKCQHGIGCVSRNAAFQAIDAAKAALRRGESAAALRHLCVATRLAPKECAWKLLQTAIKLCRGNGRVEERAALEVSAAPR